MKLINKKKLSKADESKFFEELKLLKDIDHPNIVKVFEHYQDDKYHYLISEYLLFALDLWKEAHSPGTSSFIFPFLSVKMDFFPENAGE